MTWADYLIIAICIASGAYGAWRGFTKEALSLVTWLGAVWLAWRFAWVVTPLFGRWSAVPQLKMWAARAVIFVIVLLAGGLAAWLARAVIRHSGLSAADRSLGAVFGIARGVLIVGLAVIALQLAGVDRNPEWQRAKLRPVSDRVAAGIRYYARLGGQYLEDKELVHSHQ